jgi:hypothetical protein
LIRLPQAKSDFQTEKDPVSFSESGVQNSLKTPSLRAVDGFVTIPGKSFSGR